MKRGEKVEDINDAWNTQKWDMGKDGKAGPYYLLRENSVSRIMESEAQASTLLPAAVNWNVGISNPLNYVLFSKESESTAGIKPDMDSSLYGISWVEEAQHGGNLNQWVNFILGENRLTTEVEQTHLQKRSNGDVYAIKIGFIDGNADGKLEVDNCGQSSRQGEEESQVCDTFSVTYAKSYFEKP